MRRIYFLVPNVASAQAIVSELKAASISEQQLYVVANADTPLENLPEASLLERSDLIPALERGVATGGLTGLLAGVVAVTFPPAGLILGGGALILRMPDKRSTAQTGDTPRRSECGSEF